MSIKNRFFEWCKGRFDAAAKGRHRALNILSTRYAGERQHAARFTEHAHKMQYPQFRDALLRIAADESKHAGWIAEKINELGGALPPELAIAITPTQRNSWQYLLDDLEEERLCGAELETELLAVGSDYPEVAELLQRIDDEEHKHCDAIREMLMRSDPQALWAVRRGSVVRKNGKLGG